MNRTTVIAYHAVGECPPTHDPHGLFVSLEQFQRHMAYLARRRAVVPLDVAVGGQPRKGPPRVAITFDDGYRNVLTQAGPIMARYGFQATVFVPTMWIGRRNGWMEESACDFEIMTAEELGGAGEGSLRIESHGHAHIDMSRSTAREIEYDVRTSVEELEVVLGRRPRYLAYPWGRHSQAARKAVAAAGLEAAFSIDQPHRGLYAWERVYISPHDGLGTFALKTSGRFLSWRRSLLGSSVAALTRPLRRR